MCAKISKYQIPNDQIIIMEYKRSKFQLGLKASNVTTDRTALFILKPVKCRQERENKEETIRE